MEFTYALPHVFRGGSLLENTEVLKASLDYLITLNRYFLRHHAAKPLYSSGVVYGRTEDFEPIPALYLEGYHGTDKPECRVAKRFGRFGDCKSLSGALIAEYRNQGRICLPEFRFMKNETNGGLDYHILVVTADGREDPSKRLGMGKDENAYF